MNNLAESSSSVTVIPLGDTIFRGTLISYELAQIIEWSKGDNSILFFYNRRWSGRAWICKDCGYFSKCPNCDIALAYHGYPHKQLVCHHCNFRSEIILSCPLCRGVEFQEVWIGIQKIVSDLERNFPNRKILRIDSDSNDKKSVLHKKIDWCQLIVSTYAGISLVHSENVGAVVFLLFESDLTLPDYRMEEDLYHTLEYAKKSWKEMYIQTYVPEHPLLTTLTEGNYRDFLHYISEERKKFSYPPYVDYVTIRIHDVSRDKLENMKNKLINKIITLQDGTNIAFFDYGAIEKYQWEWVVKIFLKWNKIENFLSQFEVELLKNRSITLDWNS